MQTFVAYAMADTGEGEFEKVEEEDAIETDAAELYAIEFAMRRLKIAEGNFRILCDNQSVVLELKKNAEIFRRNHRDIKEKVWKDLRSSKGKFEVDYLGNRADALLNQMWNKRISER